MPWMYINCVMESQVGPWVSYYRAPYRNGYYLSYTIFVYNKERRDTICTPLPYPPVGPVCREYDVNVLIFPDLSVHIFPYPPPEIAMYLFLQLSYWSVSARIWTSDQTVRDDPGSSCDKTKTFTIKYCTIFVQISFVKVKRQSVQKVHESTSIIYGGDETPKHKH